MIEPETQYARIGELHVAYQVVRDGPLDLAVHTGARVSALLQANEILVSGTVQDLVVGSELRFADRGSHVLEGIRDEWRVFAVDAEG